MPHHVVSARVVVPAAQHIHRTGRRRGMDRGRPHLHRQYRHKRYVEQLPHLPTKEHQSETLQRQRTTHHVTTLRLIFTNFIKMLIVDL